jgi:GNAT superfamily N-acetyltransferase
MGVPHGAHPGGTPATEHTGRTMQIRNVTTADLAALEEFGRRALDDTYLRTRWLAADEVAEMLDWWTVDYFAEALGQPNIMLLAMANDELLGMTQTEIIEPTRAVTWKLYVDKALHGTGIGSALMEATEKPYPTPSRYGRPSICPPTNRQPASTDRRASNPIETSATATAPTDGFVGRFESATIPMRAPGIHPTGPVRTPPPGHRSGEHRTAPPPEGARSTWLAPHPGDAACLQGSVTSVWEKSSPTNSSG